MEIKVDADVESVYPTLKISIMEARFKGKIGFNDHLIKSKNETENLIRANLDDPEISRRIKEYNKFYKNFDSRVPMEFQRESIARGKMIPMVNPVLTCMFIAELKNVVLTAGHDLIGMGNIVKVSVANGSEEFERMNGKFQRLKQGDVFANDEKSIISSVLYGPDSRTKVTDSTEECLFMSYAFGLEKEDVSQHMVDIGNCLESLSTDRLEIGKITIV